MKTDIGEFIVGAYLKVITGCDFVDYNVRPPGGGMSGLSELDVVGLDFKDKTAYLCEVTTHIGGLLYGKGNKDTVARIRKKYKRQREYAEKYLSNFPARRFMFWSPYVPVGYVTEHLEQIEGLECIINNGYSRCIDELREKARELACDVGNPFFRVLQILERLRR